MTAARVSSDVRDLLERSTRACGVPLHVEDAGVVELIATILRGAPHHATSAEVARWLGLAAHTNGDGDGP